MFGQFFKCADVLSLKEIRHEPKDLVDLQDDAWLEVVSRVTKRENPALAKDRAVEFARLLSRSSCPVKFAPIARHGDFLTEALKKMDMPFRPKYGTHHDHDPSDKSNYSLFHVI